MNLLVQRLASSMEPARWDRFLCMADSQRCERFSSGAVLHPACRSGQRVDLTEGARRATWLDHDQGPQRPRHGPRHLEDDRGPAETKNPLGGRSSRLDLGAVGRAIYN